MTHRLIFVGDDYVATLEISGTLRSDGQLTLEEALGELGLTVDQLQSGWYDRGTKEFIGELLPDEIAELDI